MRRIVLVLGMALALSGCAIAALPVAAQLPLWISVGAGTVAAGSLAVNAVHDCKRDGGCHDVPLPP